MFIIAQGQQIKRHNRDIVSSFELLEDEGMLRVLITIASSNQF